jgi:hypothetical protein
MSQDSSSKQITNYIHTQGCNRSRKTNPTFDECLRNTEQNDNQTTYKQLQEIFSNLISVGTNYSPMSQNTLILRNHMLNWMKLICEELGFYDLTFFTAIDIFDELLHKFNSLSNDDFLLIAISCVIISSKLNETKQVKLSFFIEYVGQKKFDKDDYLMTELLILKTLAFKLPKNNFLDFAYCIMNLLFDANSCTCKYYACFKEVYIRAISVREIDTISMFFSIIYQTMVILREDSKLLRLMKIFNSVKSVDSNESYSNFNIVA